MQIIDEFTGRVMADRSWRHGLHQAIEVKEGVTVTADKENLARLSFQRFFRQYPIMGGMTGTAWESRPVSFGRSTSAPIVRIPTNRPCVRKSSFRLRMFDTDDAEVRRRRDRSRHAKSDKIVACPILIGTRSVAQQSEEVSRRLTSYADRPHKRS